ncbi:MAG: hypothetical protein FWG25_03715 [Promicromonosporaceae bacterium]|nr:hypothetical protein [Promicromonosporaceae bacterium]
MVTITIIAGIAFMIVACVFLIRAGEHLADAETYLDHVRKYHNELTCWHLTGPNDETSNP